MYVYNTQICQVKQQPVRAGKGARELFWVYYIQIRPIKTNRPFLSFFPYLTTPSFFPYVSKPYIYIYGFKYLYINTVQGPVYLEFPHVSNSRIACLICIFHSLNALPDLSQVHSGLPVYPRLAFLPHVSHVFVCFFFRRFVRLFLFISSFLSLVPQRFFFFRLLSEIFRQVVVPWLLFSVRYFWTTTRWLPSSLLFSKTTQLSVLWPNLPQLPHLTRGSAHSLTLQLPLELQQRIFLSLFCDVSASALPAITRTCFGSSYSVAVPILSKRSNCDDLLTAYRSRRHSLINCSRLKNSVSFCSISFAVSNRILFRSVSFNCLVENGLSRLHLRNNWLCLFFQKPPPKPELGFRRFLLVQSFLRTSETTASLI